MLVGNLELRLYDNELHGNLNFWDHMQGNDVIADIDTEGNLTIKGEKITFPEYLKLVKTSVESGNKLAQEMRDKKN